MSWHGLGVTPIVIDIDLIGALSLPGCWPWAFPTQATLAWDWLSINLVFNPLATLGVLRAALLVGNNCITINLHLESLPVD
jgi:hypothetical protein